MPPYFFNTKKFLPSYTKLVAIMYRIMLWLLLVSTCTIQAHNSTNKTFFAPRPQATYFPYESNTWRWSTEQQHIVSTSIIGAYSTNAHDISRYFLFNDSSCLTINGNNGVCVDHRHLKFDEEDPNAFAGILRLCPKADTLQLLLTHYWTLTPQAQQSFFFTWSLPISHITYDPGLCIDENKRSSDYTACIKDYFHGQTLITGSRGCGCMQSTIPLQDPLQWGRICDKKSKNGVADIYLGLGYLPCNSKRTKLAVRAEGIIPTNRSSRARRLFEPIVGSAGHWGVGLRADFAHTILEQEHHGLLLISHARWHYFMSHNARRTLGLTRADGSSYRWAQYQLVGQLGLPLVAPGANVLTRIIKSKPKHQGELALIMAYRYRSWELTLGYDSWIRSKEQLELKECWPQCTYAFPKASFKDMLVSFGNDTCPIDEYSPDPPEPTFTLASATNKSRICRLSSGGPGCPIDCKQLSVKPAEIPHVHTHMVFGTLSRGWYYDKNSIIATIGGGYEHAHNNSALSLYMLWGSLKLQF